MKRRLSTLLALIAVVVFSIPATVTAQEEKEKETEKKVEKRIKIVTVDEKGEKTVLDTLLTGDEDMQEILIGKDLKWVSEEGMGERIVKTGDGNVYVYSNAGDAKFSVYAKGDKKFISEDGEVYMFKKGDKDSFSIVTIDEEGADKHKSIMIHIDEDAVHSKDGNIIMKSSKGKSHAYVVKVDKDGENIIEWVEQKSKLEDGQVHIMIESNNEMDDFIIDGDAVITIKDGKVSIEGDGLKMKTKEEGDSKAASESKEKKIIKK